MCGAVNGFAMLPKPYSFWVVPLGPMEFEFGRALHPVTWPLFGAIKNSSTCHPSCCPQKIKTSFNCLYLLHLLLLVITSLLSPSMKPLTCISRCVTDNFFSLKWPTVVIWSWTARRALTANRPTAMLALHTFLTVKKEGDLRAPVIAIMGEFPDNTADDSSVQQWFTHDTRQPERKVTQKVHSNSTSVSIMPLINLIRLQQCVQIAYGKPDEALWL